MLENPWNAIGVPPAITILWYILGMPEYPWNLYSDTGVTLAVTLLKNIPGMPDYPWNPKILCHRGTRSHSITIEIPGMPE